MRTRLLLGGFLLAVALAALVATAHTATPTSAPKAQRIELAAGLPAFAPGYRLSLTRAVVPPGASFPPHRHPGMQVAYVESGTLQYTVFRGHVKIYRGPPEGSPRVVRVVTAGHTGSIATGDWIIETPSLWHKATNRGRKTVVIVLAALLRADEPPAIPVKP
jgi:hypothetical protein